MQSLSRRDALKRMAIGGVLATLPVALPSGTERDLLRPMARRLTDLFSGKQSAAAVGERYLALAPQEADPTVLTARIVGSVPNYLRLAAVDAHTLRARLLEQQRDDFAHQRVVSVEGWVLSCTEVRLCALVALDRSIVG